MWESEGQALPHIPDDKFWWTALVQFEKSPKRLDQELLADEEQGAYVWVAAVARDEREVDKLVKKAAREEGLRVIDIADYRIAEDLEEINDLDEHLADDVVEKTSGQVLAWGTWHVYYGDGEA